MNANIEIYEAGKLLASGKLNSYPADLLKIEMALNHSCQFRAHISLIEEDSMLSSMRTGEPADARGDEFEPR